MSIDDLYEIYDSWERKWLVDNCDSVRAMMRETQQPDNGSASARDGERRGALFSTTAGENPAAPANRQPVDISMLRRKARRGLFGKNGILKDQFTGISDAIEFVIDLIPSCSRTMERE